MASLKKTISFATPEGKALIDSALALEAQCTGFTIAGLHESHLLSSLLPHHEPYASLARILILSRISAGEVIQKWVSDMGNSANSTPSGAIGFLPFVRFCQQHAADQATVTNTEHIEYITLQGKNVCSVLNDNLETSGDPAWLKLQIRRLEMELDSLNTNQTMVVAFIFDLLNAYCDLLEKYDCAYKLLALTALHCSWPAKDRTTYDMLKLLRSLGSVTPEHS